MKITSSKLEAKIVRSITEHEGKLDTLGLWFGFTNGSESVRAKFTSETRHVTLEIPLAEMRRMVKQYHEWEEQYPEHFGQSQANDTVTVKVKQSFTKR